MRSRAASLLRRATLAVCAVAAAASTAAAQVQATFYESFPTTPPDPNLPFAGGAVICTATAAGTASGFTLNFSNAATRALLCPSNPDRLNPAVNTFGARFTGSLVVPAAGTYSLTIDADDGDQLAVNGTVVRTDWISKAGGPGLVGSIALNAGSNPFVLDYFQSPVTQAFINLQVGAGISVTPPPGQSVVPEPATVVLTATGLLALAGVARRRRG